MEQECNVEPLLKYICSTKKLGKADYFCAPEVSKSSSKGQLLLQQIDASRLSAFNKPAKSILNFMIFKYCDNFSASNRMLVASGPRMQSNTRTGKENSASGLQFHVSAEGKSSIRSGSATVNRAGQNPGTEPIRLRDICFLRRQELWH